eukprot:scpid107342/ scgid32096/ 
MLCASIVARMMTDAFTYARNAQSCSTMHARILTRSMGTAMVLLKFAKGPLNRHCSFLLHAKTNSFHYPFDSVSQVDITFYRILEIFYTCSKPMFIDKEATASVRNLLKANYFPIRSTHTCCLSACTYPFFLQTLSTGVDTSLGNLLNKELLRQVKNKAERLKLRHET